MLRRGLKVTGAAAILASMLNPATPAQAAGPAPTVTAVTASAGTVCGGTTVTISGTNLQDATSIAFGSSTITSGFTVSPTGTSISVDKTPPHDIGTVDVVVTTPNGPSTVNPPGDEFSYVGQAPHLSGIAPNKTSSTKTAGQIPPSIISGACFIDQANVSAVSFGSTAAGSYTVGFLDGSGTFTPGDSATSGFPGPNAIEAAPPADSPSGLQQSVSTTVTGAARASNGETYYYVSAPAVAQVSPSSGTDAGGTQVTITGNDFQGGTGACDIIGVTFGTAVATPPATCTDTSAIVTSPASSTDGAVDVVVTTDGGGSSTSTLDKFTYNPPATPPVVSDLSTHGGSSAGGDSVTITGLHFGSCAVTQVLFGTAAYNEPATGWAAGNNCGDTSFTVTSTPAHTCGTVDVIVVTGSGQSTAVQADHFTYLSTDIPCVDSIAPAKGPTAGGTPVTITGSGFAVGDSVSFGSQAATVSTVSPDGTQITTTSPSQLQAGAQDVTVANSNGTSVTSPADVFTYVAAPTVSSVSPTQGRGSGGDSVTVSGSGFQGGGSSCDVLSVHFGSAAATLPQPLTCTDSAITVTTPPDLGGGAVNVTVTTDGGTSSTTTIPPNSDQYTYVAVPSVSSVSPASGPQAGGTSVTVDGSGFYSDKGSCDVTSVKFGSVSGSSPACQSDGALTVTAPPALASGPVDVTVTTGDGGTSPTSSKDVYTYQPACNSFSGTVGSGTGSGGTEYSQPVGSTWALQPGAANYIASGGGQTFVLGTNAVSGGWGIYRWTGSGWSAYPGGLVDIAVGSDGTPWGVNSSQQIFHWTPGGWQQLPGAAYDIAAGPGGSVFALGVNSVGGGCGIYKWTGAGWAAIDGGGIQLAVGSNDYPWVINNTDSIWAFNGGGWVPEPGSAQMIAATAGSVWVLGTNAVGGGWGIYYFTGAGWGSIPGGAVTIAVGTNKLPWVTNEDQAIYQRT